MKNVRSSTIRVVLSQAIFIVGLTLVSPLFAQSAPETTNQNHFKNFLSEQKRFLGLSMEEKSSSLVQLETSYNLAIEHLNNSEDVILLKLSRLYFYARHRDDILNLPYPDRLRISTWLLEERNKLEELKSLRSKTDRSSSEDALDMSFSMTFVAIHPRLAEALTSTDPSLKSYLQTMGQSLKTVDSSFPSLPVQSKSELLTQIILVVSQRLHVAFETMVQESWLTSNAQNNSDELSSRIQTNKKLFDRSEQNFLTWLIGITESLYETHEETQPLEALDLGEQNRIFQVQVTVPRGSSVKSYIESHFSEKAFDTFKDAIGSLNESIRLEKSFDQDTIVNLPLKLWILFPERRDSNEDDATKKEDPDATELTLPEDSDAVTLKEEEAVQEHLLSDDPKYDKQSLKDDEPTKDELTEEAKKDEITQDEAAKDEMTKTEETKKAEEEKLAQEIAKKLNADLEVVQKVMEALKNDPEKFNQLVEALKQNPNNIQELAQKYGMDPADVQKLSQELQKNPDLVDQIQKEMKKDEEKKTQEQKAQEKAQEKAEEQKKEEAKQEELKKDIKKEALKKQPGSSLPWWLKLLQSLSPSEKSPEPALLATYAPPFQDAYFKTVTLAKATQLGFDIQPGLSEDTKTQGTPESLMTIDPVVDGGWVVLLFPSSGQFKEFVRNPDIHPTWQPDTQEYTFDSSALNIVNDSVTYTAFGLSQRIQNDETDHYENEIFHEPTLFATAGLTKDDVPKPLKDYLETLFNRSDLTAHQKITMLATIVSELIEYNLKEDQRQSFLDDATAHGTNVYKGILQKIEVSNISESGTVTFAHPDQKVKSTCSTYAELFVMLFRLFSKDDTRLPSRAVGGYVGHKGWVLSFPAHEWAEVYLKDQGWMIVEATGGAAFSNEGENPSDLQNKFDQLSSAGDMYGQSQATPKPSTEQQKAQKNEAMNGGEQGSEQQSGQQKNSGQEQGLGEKTEKEQGLGEGNGQGEGSGDLDSTNPAPPQDNFDEGFYNFMKNGDAPIDKFDLPFNMSDYGLDHLLEKLSQGLDSLHIKPREIDPKVIEQLIHEFNDLLPTLTWKKILESKKIQTLLIKVSHIGYGPFYSQIIDIKLGDESAAWLTTLHNASVMMCMLMQGFSYDDLARWCLTRSLEQPVQFTKELWKKIIALYSHPTLMNYFKPTESIELMLSRAISSLEITEGNAAPLALLFKIILDNVQTHGESSDSECQHLYLALRHLAESQHIGRKQFINLCEELIDLDITKHPDDDYGSLDIILDIYIQNMHAEDLNFYLNGRAPFFFLHSRDLQKFIPYYMKAHVFDQMERRIFNMSQLTDRNLLFATQYLLQNYDDMYRKNKNQNPLSSFTKVFHDLDTVSKHQNETAAHQNLIRSNPEVQNPMEDNHLNPMTVQGILLFLNPKTISETASDVEVRNYADSFIQFFNQYWKTSELNDSKVLFLFEKLASIMSLHPNVSLDSFLTAIEIYLHETQIAILDTPDKDDLILSLTHISKYLLSKRPTDEALWIDWFLKFQEKNISESLAPLLKEVLGHPISGESK